MKPNQRIKYGILDVGNAVDLDHPLNRGRVAWWYTPPGLGAGSRLLDLLGRFHGTLTNGPRWMSGRRGEVGLEFAAASSQLVSAGTLPILPSGSAWSAAFTLTPNAKNGSARTVIAKRSSFANANISFCVAIRASDDPAPNRLVAFTTTTLREGPTLAVGRSQRVVVAGNSSAANFFVDGNLATSVASSTLAGLGTVAPLGIGGLVTEASEYYDGYLADLSVWSRALTADEIEQDYRLSLANYQTPDSPLRWLGTRSYFLPGGGASRVCPSLFTSGIFGQRK